METKETRIMKRHYQVGGHAFEVSAGENDWRLMENYEPFRCETEPEDCETEPEDMVFSLQVTSGNRISYIEDLRQDEEEQVIICGKTAEGLPVFEFCWNGVTAGWLLCQQDFRNATLYATDQYRKLSIDNALMVLYALATANRNTVLFHSAVVSYKEQAYMFLGTSGTGKSTHARLWLQYIDGTELVNDDNPVVRLHDDGSAWVYGSPWSGKTPCYRNVCYPLGALVMLKQAPHNSIVRLKGLTAYATLVPSISGMRWNQQVANGLHATENTLASNVPTWLLECLPDEQAAITCQQAIAP